MNDCCSGDNAKNSYDLIVVGAGSAGFSASITAAGAGKRVALVGHGTIGGTCVNVGCVPSKAMIRAAEAVHGAATAGRFPGIEPCEHQLDWGALDTGTTALVDEMRQKKYIDLLPDYEGVEYIDEGPARLIEGGVPIGERTLASELIIIATGARPHMPEIPGINGVEVLDSTAFMTLPQRPKNLIVMGGGYIGAELAKMGSKLRSSRARAYWPAQNLKSPQHWPKRCRPKESMWKPACPIAASKPATAALSSPLSEAASRSG